MVFVFHILSRINCTPQQLWQKAEMIDGEAWSEVMGMGGGCIVLAKVMEQQNKQFNLTCMLHSPWCFYLIFRGLSIQNSFLMKKTMNK